MLTPVIVVRWAARTWGVAGGLLLLAFAFGGREHFQPTPWEVSTIV